MCQLTKTWLCLTWYCNTVKGAAALVLKDSFTGTGWPCLGVVGTFVEPLGTPNRIIQNCKLVFLNISNSVENQFCGVPLIKLPTPTDCHKDHV